jgi:asparagine synthase (glutamine-hydrolysing)
MIRYVAFLWSHHAPSNESELVRRLGNQLAADSERWIQGFCSDGLAVYCAGLVRGVSQVYGLYAQGGVILGSLFSRSFDGTSMPCNASLDESQTRAIVTSGGQTLIESYWGAYVGFIRNAPGRTSWIVRAPVGTLPCYWTEVGKLRIYFSHFEDCFRLGLAPNPLEENWAHVARLLAHPGAAPSGQTGLMGIHELLGGACHEHCRGRERRSFFLWDPVSLADLRSLEDPTEAVSAVRRDALDVVRSATASYGSIVHTLSGGFDSAMALALMRLAAHDGARATCVNYHSPGTRSDERRYAAAVAAHLGCELITHRREGTRSLDPLMSTFPEPIPQNDIYYLASVAAEARYAGEAQSPVVTSGFGGDQLFCQSRALASIDYWARHRDARGLFQIAFDEARLEQDSVWTTLAQAVRRKSWDAYADMGRCCSLLRPEALRALKVNAADDTHPMLVRGQGDRRRVWQCVGKLHQIQYLLKPPRAQNPFGSPDHPSLLAVLYAQPLVETCIRIPTYRHTQGGWDRVVARRAMRPDLPYEIVHRRSKGGFEEDAKQTLVANREMARQLVMDCEPLSQLLDRKLFDAAITGRFPASNVELYDCVFFAAWFANVAKLRHGSGVPAHGAGLVAGSG